MTRRAPTYAVLIALLISTLSPLAVGAVEAPLPTSMAAVGDSITQAASSAGSLGADAPQNSWSTGTSSSVNSHYLRLLGAGADISGRNYNRSVSGAKMVNLNAQMQTAAGLTPDYLTVLIGGNDLCTDTVGEMTDPTVFGNQFRQAMTTITSLSPNTHVYVVSIPNVYQLWQLFRNNWWARFIWSSADICQSLLANPTSTQTADVQRREAVRQRNIAYNAQLATVCGQFAACLFDNNAVFNTPFTTSDVSGDYFHPSAAGQAKLASVSWGAGYRWTTTPPPPPPPPPDNQPPEAGFTFACTDLNCTFTDGSTDADGTIASRSWSFGDGTTSSDTDPAHTYGAANTYTVSLTVTDDAGGSDIATETVTVTTPPSPTGTMVLQTVVGSSQPTGKNTWTATVRIEVADDAGGLVDGATVSGSWSTGESATCVTVDGSCSVTSANHNLRKVASVTLTISAVTHPTLTWSGSATEVIVARP